ncbi:MAG: DUF3105 domain-containing protein, partial [Acidimicrobiia bacterium]|nr:DUF3105 domain-containing protein [Acidimicrobiia bacterium]
MRRALVVSLLVLAACGGSGDDGDDPGFPVENPEDVGNAHLSEAQVEAITAGTEAPPRYSSVPASSGAHAPRWSPCGIYREEVNEIHNVHTLEHGAVIVYYQLDAIDDATLTAV